MSIKSINGYLVRQRYTTDFRSITRACLLHHSHRHSHSCDSNKHPFTTDKIKTCLTRTPRLSSLCQMQSLSSCMSAVPMYRSRIEEYIVPYDPPVWVKHLKNAPSKKLELACTPTPIHRWHLPGLPDGITVHIKRDDMTGSVLTGNKVRKLEFLLADAITRGCRHVITTGSIDSNHCRTVAVACAQLGLKAHLLLLADTKALVNMDSMGNVFLDRMTEAELYFVPRKSPYASHRVPRMQALAAAIEKSTGEKSYLIPVGGSNTIGLWGYLNAFHELTNQNVADRFDDIVTGCGSSGTSEGLAVGNHFSKSGLKVHGVAVCDDAEYFHSEINNNITELGLGPLRSEDILDVIEGYKGLGYSISQQKELDFITDVAKRTGVMLEPTYTGKAAYGLVQELQQNPARFKGKRILFIHTGGVFGMFDGKLKEWLKGDTEAKSRIHHWPDVDGAVPATANY